MPSLTLVRIVRGQIIYSSATAILVPLLADTVSSLFYGRRPSF